MTTNPTELPQTFEDFSDGFSVSYRVPGLSKAEIIEFATRYDPQRFHLDEAEAAKTHFGALAASGFQTQLLCFRPFCEMVLLNSSAVGAPGVDKLLWHRPWFPGEDLDVKVSLVSKRPSSNRNDRGYVGFQLVAHYESLPLLTMDWVVIMLTRTVQQGD